METNNGDEELSLSETVFTNNSEELTDNENLSEHGMSGDAAELFREFTQGIDTEGQDFAQGVDDGVAASSDVVEAGETTAGGDVRLMLAQKEKDLILAAELGKALLEDNEELTRKQTHMAKEHAEHIEALEQEKHELRRRLEITEGKYDNKIVDLQTELTAIRKELTHQMTSSRLADKDKQEMIAELMEQNQRLNTQLAQASEATDTLTTKLQHLQKHPPRVRRKTSSTASDKRTIEDLHDEVKLMNSKTRELERRIYSLTEEREALLCSLKESSDRVMMYEKHSIDMQQQLEVRDGELAKARHMHNAALEELEELRFQTTMNNSGNHNNNNSLFFELGGMGDDSQMKPLPSPGALSMDFEEGDGEMERHEPGRDAIVLMIPEEDDVFEEGAKSDPLLKADRVGNTDAMKDNKYKKVLEEVYCVLSDILWELRTFNKKSANSHGSRRRRRSSSGSVGQKSKRVAEDSPRPSSRTEEVRTQLTEVKSLLQGILASQQTQRSPGSDSSRRKLSLDDHTHIYSLESHIETLRGDLCGTQTHIELLKAELDNQDEQMRRKDEELSKLHVKAGQPFVGTVHSQLHSLQDELLSVGYPENGREPEIKPKDEPRSQIARVEPVRQEPSLRSTVATSNHEGSPRDEIIKRLQNERDEAIAKRNSAEMELTQARLDMMNLDGQLLEAINQKLELSQELDQWQVDIHELLDDRLRQQLRKQELERRKAKAAGASTKSSKTKLAALQKKFPFLNLKLTPDK